jgi:hypothetical protein
MQAWHNRVVTKLMYSAMGDLMLTSSGDLAYRQIFDEKTSKDLPHEISRPAQILAKISRHGWTLTAEGCLFILENCPPQDVREVNKLTKVFKALMPEPHARG